MGEVYQNVVVQAWVEVVVSETKPEVGPLHFRDDLLEQTGEFIHHENLPVVCSYDLVPGEDCGRSEEEVSCLARCGCYGDLFGAGRRKAL